MAASHPNLVRILGPDLHKFLTDLECDEFEIDLTANKIYTLYDLRTAMIDKKTCKQLNIPNWAYETIKDKLLDNILADNNVSSCNNPYIV